MKHWDIVLVHWVDSSGIGSWTNTDTILEDEHISKCWTAGFFLGYNEQCIKIVSSASSSDSVDHIMYIPKICIKGVTLIKEGLK